MDLKLEGFSFDNREFFQKSIEIRSIVFIHELGFDKHLEFDGKDLNSIHYIILCDGITVGTARIIETNETLTIDRFCILKEYRSKGFGLVFIKFILNEIFVSKKEISVFSVTESLEFFILLGFKFTGQIKDFGKMKVSILKY